MKLICSRIKNHVQINGFALSLALKQRLGANLEMACWHLDSYSLPPRDNAATYNQFQPQLFLPPAVLVLSFPSNVQVCSFGSVTVLSNTAGWWGGGFKTCSKSCNEIASPQTSFGVRLSRRNECVTNEPQRTSAGRLVTRENSPDTS